MSDQMFQNLKTRSKTLLSQFLEKVDVDGLVQEDYESSSNSSDSYEPVEPQVSMPMQRETHALNFDDASDEELELSNPRRISKFYDDSSTSFFKKQKS